jgi:HemY protein
VPTETVFPIGRPPDDPGPEQPAPAKRASLFGS